MQAQYATILIHIELLRLLLLLLLLICLDCCCCLWDPFHRSQLASRKLVLHAIATLHLHQTIMLVMRGSHRLAHDHFSFCTACTYCHANGLAYTDFLTNLAANENIWLVADIRRSYSANRLCHNFDGRMLLLLSASAALLSLKDF